MNLTWKPSVRASAWYAADCCFAATNDPLAVLAAPLVTALTRLLNPVASPCDSTSRRLLEALLVAEANEDSRDDDSWPSAARAWLEREGASAATTDEAIEILNQLLARITAAAPRLAGDLPLRLGPLREMWEAYGPGMMRFLRRRLWPNHGDWTATVLAVHPMLGGGGKAWGTTPAVVMEAVLTNRWPRLPEVVRLAWLLAQYPATAAAAHGAAGSGAPDSAKLPAALIPHVLEAAAYVELATLDAPTQSLALQQWITRGP